jgi:hypothetical protein
MRIYLLINNSPYILLYPPRRYAHPVSPVLIPVLVLVLERERERERRRRGERRLRRIVACYNLLGSILTI